MHYKERLEQYEISLKRRTTILMMIASGKSMAHIARKFKISRQRVYQICIKPPKKPKRTQFDRIWKHLPAWARSGRNRTREMVRIRDKHTCQSCRNVWKAGERSFDVHHTNGLCGKKSRGYDSIDDMDGLITLCHKCHFNHPDHTIKKRKQVIHK